jgi:hypothetical protein
VASTKQRRPASDATTRAQPKRAKAVPHARGGRASNVRVERSEPPLDRRDRWIGAAVGVGAALVFLTTFSPDVALGDAPETVAGVKSLGILHAPGYPVYVVLARLFGEIVRIGSWEFRVNLFSLVCASITVGGVYLLARRFGANKPGAVIGALALATSASFWFNAGFAKYYPLSALFVVVVVLCILGWRDSGRTWLLVAGGIVLGLSVGVSWQLMAIPVAGIAALLFFERPRPAAKPLLLSAGIAVATALAVCIYTVVRAGQDPDVNFGSATGVGRLWDLFTAADFKGLRTAQGAGASHVFENTGTFSVVLARDIGLIVTVLAVVGIVDVFMRRRLGQGLFLLIVGLGNVVAIGLAAGKQEEIIGFFNGLISGGQLTNALIVLAILAALGISRVGFHVDAWLPDAPRALPIATTVLLAILVIVPSFVVHRGPADHNGPPFADRYAAHVLQQMPPDGILLAGGYEFGQPFVNRQVTHGDAPGVDVVYGDLLSHEWYRERVVDRLHLDQALVQTTAENPVPELVAALRATGRPVFADAISMLRTTQEYGYQPLGLIAPIVDGAGPVAGGDYRSAAEALYTAEARDGMTARTHTGFPNVALYTIHSRAHVELAKQYALANDLEGAATELERATELDLTNEDHRDFIAKVRRNDPEAVEAILRL